MMRCPPCAGVAVELIPEEVVVRLVFLPLLHARHKDRAHQQPAPSTSNRTGLGPLQTSRQKQVPNSREQD